MIKLVKRLSLGGILGPCLFTIVTIVCSTIRPGYNHISQFISELGATGSSNARLMNFTAFIPSGILIALFGIATISLLPKKAPGIIGSVLIIIFGLGMITAGCFSCDPGCPREGSLANNIHDRISGPAFISAIIGILLLGLSFRKLLPWRSHWVYSVISALLSFGFMIMLIISLETRGATGLWQRLLLLTIFLWLSVVSLKMYKDQKVL